MSTAPARGRTAAKCEDAVVDGRLELVIQDENHEAVGDALAGLLLAVLEREGLIGSAP
jgi:hypothetical protein